jgi:hypothetical protein
VREQHLHTRTSRKLVPIEGVERKAACLPHTDGFALFPLLHDAERLV